MYRVFNGSGRIQDRFQQRICGGFSGHLGQEGHCDCNAEIQLEKFLTKLRISRFIL